MDERAFLGVDAAGRDRLSFVQGAAGVPPYPAWVLQDSALSPIAHLLRRLHAATAPIAGRRDLPWDRTFADDRVDHAVVGHNDARPENEIFRGGTATAFIDFDDAAPSSALLDLAHLLRMWVPLGVRPGPDRPATLRRRLRAALTAHGTTSSPALQEAIRRSVGQAEVFVRTTLHRPDLTAAHFDAWRAELVDAATTTTT